MFSTVSGTDYDGFGKTRLYKGTRNTMKMWSESLAPMALVKLGFTEPSTIPWRRGRSHWLRWFWENFLLQSHQQHPEDGDGVTDSDGFGKTSFYTATSNTLKMGTESLTPMALVKLGFTEPPATPWRWGQCHWLRWLW